MIKLVTGVSGFVGTHLYEELLGNKYRVMLAVRTAISRNGDLQQVVIEAIDARTEWTVALKNVDVVVHLAARVHVMKDAAINPLDEFRNVNVDGTLNLAKQAANAGVKRFIFISSIKVNGENTEIGKPFLETDKENPQDAYGTSKYEAEQGLMRIAEETGMEVVIIRPPLVYGAGVKANFASMMHVIKRSIPLPLGAIHNKRSFVYVGNLVSLIIHCIDHPAAANQTFLVSDGHDVSTTELLCSCADALGVKARLLPVPQKFVEICAAIIGKRDVAQRLCGNLQVDISKARLLLGWAPPVSLAEGLKATAQGMKAEHH
jgi:nucleoside-diphosphate-sugar epimerase